MSTPASRLRSSCSESITSVSTGRPVRALASSRISSEAVSPWKECGLVRGFHTPPRKTSPPASFTAAAVS